MSESRWFESEEHRREFQSHLLRRDIPLKFAFSGSAAYTHDRLASEAGYHAVTLALKQELTALRAIERSIETPLAEVGPGNGHHTIALLKHLLDHGEIVRLYFALDFSSELLSLARTRIQAAFPHMKLMVHTWDFETTTTQYIHAMRQAYNITSPLVVLFIGHTIGNPDDPAAVLLNLANSLRAGDTLVLSFSIYTPSRDPASYLRDYETAAFRAAALEPLAMWGIDLNHVELRLSFVNRCVEALAIVQAPITTPTGDPLLPSGTSIRCFHSRRFLLDEVYSILGRAAFAVVASQSDLKDGHACITAVLK